MYWGWWAAAHRSDTVYFGQPDAPGQEGGGPVQVPVMYLGIPREGGRMGGEHGQELGGGESQEKN